MEYIDIFDNEINKELPKIDFNINDHIVFSRIATNNPTLIQVMLIACSLVCDYFFSKMKKKNNLYYEPSDIIHTRY